MIAGLLRNRVSEIKKMLEPKGVVVEDVQRAMIVQIILLAQDLDVAFNERAFVAARSAGD